MGWGGPNGAGPHGGPVANAELRLAYLKNDLKLTDSQTAAWTAYEDAMKKHAASMQARRDAMFKAGSAQDRMTLMSEFARQRAQDVDAVSGALNGLYAVLTPEQKTIADASFGGRMFGMGPRGPGRFR
jgi:hypothetical protein